MADIFSPYDDLDLLSYLGIGGKKLEDTSQGRPGFTPDQVPRPTNPYGSASVGGALSSLGVEGKPLSETSQGRPGFTPDQVSQPTNPYADLDPIGYLMGAFNNASLPENVSTQAPTVQPFREVGRIDTGIDPSKAENPQLIQQVTGLDQTIDTSLAQQEGIGQPYSDLGAEMAKVKETATKKTEAALTSGSLSTDQEKSLFDMIKGAGQQFGQGLEMGWDSFQKLSPSTKAALFGSAAALIAHATGNKRMGGQIAGTTAQMWQGLHSLESQQEHQKEMFAKQGMKDLVLQQMRDQQATREAALKAGEEAGLDPKKVSSSERDTLVEQALLAVEEQADKGFLGIGGDSDEEKLNKAQQLVDQLIKQHGADAVKVLQASPQRWFTEAYPYLFDK